MIIYVATYTCGFGDENFSGNLYVGCYYDKAVKSITDFSFPSDSNQWGNIEFWENEELMKNQEFYLSDNLGEIK